MARAARLAPDARREQILHCALRLFAEKGLAGVRHTEVAHAAGVALPTVIHYFPQREDLLALALEEVRRFLLEDIVAPRLATDQPALEALRDILMHFCAAIDTHADHVRVWLAWSVAVGTPLWPSYLRFHEDALRGIAELVRRGQTEYSIDGPIDPSDASRVIVGLAHLIVQMRFSGSDEAAIARTIDSLVSGYLGPSNPPIT